MGAAALLSIPLALLFTWTQVLPLDGIPALGTDYGQLVWNVWSAPTNGLKSRTQVR